MTEGNKIMVLWNVTPCGWTKGHRVTEEASAVIIIFVHDRVHYFTLKIHAKKQICPKHCYISVSVYGVTSKKTVNSTVSTLHILYRV